MKIGFLLPANFALSSRGNGVKVQLIEQANALEAIGHEVIRMTAWDNLADMDLDVIQFVQGGFQNIWIENHKKHLKQPLVFAPIFDTNVKASKYRFAAKIGHKIGKIFTIPQVLQDQCKAADLIVTRSKFEQQRIVDCMNVDIEKTCIVHNGIPLPEATDVQAVRDKFDLPEQFIFHLSVYSDPRKNVKNMIKAIAPTGKPLIIAGIPMKNRHLPEIEKMVAEYDQIKIIGQLEDAERNALYQACHMLCLPSHHEGTGLAALEAASYESGVVITENGGTKDYFSSFAYYVNPENVDQIRSQILACWNRPHAKELKQFVIDNHTWEQSAKSLIAAYEKHLSL